MQELLSNSTYFAVALTLVCFQIGVGFKKKTGWAVATPLLTATILIIAVLLLFDIPYESYKEGAKIINFFMTPATVCLAIPLYRQIELLKKYPKAIFGGIISGVLTTMVSIYLMSLAFGLSHQQYVTLLPKSITTPIAVEICQTHSGIVPVTVIAVIFTGILGSILAPFLLRLFRVKNPITAGLAIGACSHAVGTSKALELGETEGAMSGLAIGVCGIIPVIVSMLM